MGRVAFIHSVDPAGGCKLRLPFSFPGKAAYLSNICARLSHFFDGRFYLSGGHGKMTPAVVAGLPTGSGPIWKVESPLKD